VFNFTKLATQLLPANQGSSVGNLADGDYKMRKALWSGLLSLFCVFLITPLAKANQLPPGGLGAPDAFVLGYSGCPGPTGGTPCGPRRTVVASNLPGAPTWGVAPFTGSVYEQVESDPTNVFCAGCMDFLFQVQNNSTSNQNITRIEETGFSPYLVDVGYDSASFGSLVLCGIDDGGFCNNGDIATVPGSVDRSADGNTVGFNFPLGVKAGENTVDIVIETNATSFTGPIATIRGSLGATGTVDIWGPSGPPVISTPTPEPSALFLLGTGLLALMGAKRYFRLA
jgi:hypothetical protein